MTPTTKPDARMLDIAMKCYRRGWHVFPCWPGKKNPPISNGFKGATNDLAQILAWWEKWPDANIGVATAMSGLTVLDIDKGISDADALRSFMAAHNLPKTYTIRTGRRPGFGVQLYFEGGGLRSIAWDHETIHGDVRSGSGYVMAEGCRHPSGAFYECLDGAAIADEPDFVRALQPVQLPPVAVGATMRKIPEGGGRHDALARVAGTFRAMGFDADGIYEQLAAANERMCAEPVPDEDLHEMADGFERRYPAGEIAPEVVIGKARALEVADPLKPWESFYHGFDEMTNAPDMAFLIDNFMHAESITGLCAAVGQRKSLIALNVAHALCTGEPLFGKFAVTQRPKRVLYLCPEMGMRSFRKRVLAIGLMPYVGKTFFCRTMNMEDSRGLDDLTREEIDDAVIILDTAVRFTEGDENSVAAMKGFAASCFRLAAREGVPGAAALFILYHSGKGAKETSELTMENSLRGSGELGAALTCCYATRLQDPEQKFTSLSYISCVKPRDFDTEPPDFEASCDKSCRMTFVESVGKVVLKSRPKGFLADRDGNDGPAQAVIDANPKLSGAKISALLKEHGIKRSPDWCNKRKVREGATLTES